MIANIETSAFYYADEDDDDAFISIYNLLNQDDYYELLVSFGNYIFKEVRLVGETKAAIIIFTRLMQKSGYEYGIRKSQRIKNEATLFQAGDVVFPKDSDAFIFLDPIAKNGETVNFMEFEAECKYLEYENMDNIAN